MDVTKRQCVSKKIAYALIPLLLISATSCKQDSDLDYQKLTEAQKRSAKNATLGLTTRAGLETTLFAAEGMLVNPTNMDIDAAGRVWVTEGYNYRPSLNPDNPTKSDGDRIVILEDTNGDSKADTTKVFYQGNDINAALGIMVLDERVYVSRSPYVFVFTDANGDDKADKKEVLFSGIKGVQHDHGMHAFVFGPDGKLYFNMGNEGEMLKDADGNPVIDRFGNKVTADETRYHQGMVFRSDLNGNNVDVVAHNFRNNYEVAVDSYGTLWQSDNDDDGNRAVRINYVMEYGNYGFTDEVTGAGWRSRRIGMADEIPTRHWYQKDPGVVPNLLQTGAGSPTGMVLYEGDLLPEVFQNQMIHVDAGPNVVRSYPVEKKGAGYTARIENIVEGKHDQWFRPSDVTVAPDGSIFVADWYDPGVGGHQMGDQQRGRIFRIAPNEIRYQIPDFNLATPAGAVEALKSPNMNRRALAWLALQNFETKAEPALLGLWNSDNQRFRARALWLLSKLPQKGEQYIQDALSDSNPDIRITALRAARQLPIAIDPYLEQLAKDTSPQVRREVAIALHRHQSANAARVWTSLATKYDGTDRWYLEALGIGAAGQWDSFFDKWLETVGREWNTPAGRDIIWRSRSTKALPMLVDIITDETISSEEKTRFFRAFHFHEAEAKQEYLISILESSLADQEQINLLTLKALNRSALLTSITVRRALEQTLADVKETQEYLDLVEKFELENRTDELLHLMQAYPDSSLGIRASRLALTFGGKKNIEDALDDGNDAQKKILMSVLGETSTEESVSMLSEIALDKNESVSVQKQAVQALGNSWPGELKLVELVKSGLLPELLHPTAAEGLSDSWRGDVRQLAAELTGESTTQQNDLPPIADLVAMEGDLKDGEKVFEQSCQICHTVSGEGASFGPDLSTIGAKLPKTGMYDAILNPNSGINFGYEGYEITLKDGSISQGIIQSETGDQLTIMIMGGSTFTYSKDEIAERKELSQSLMPEQLERTMSKHELVSLVEYLTTLR